LIASRQLEGATDPHVIAALTRISEDEAQHAELAWSFVRWALETGGDDVHLAARDAFHRAATTAFELPPEALEVDPDTWRSHGRSSPSDLAFVVSEAMRSVIVPCADVLLANRHGP